MAALNMKGPYRLDETTIDKQVTKIFSGNYAFGRKNDKGIFLVGYVGRSDGDVNGRLKYWVKNSRRPLFKYSYAPSPKAAFEKECHNYHDFGPPGNKIHPARQEGTDWKCPVCRA